MPQSRSLMHRYNPQATAAHEMLWNMLRLATIGPNGLVDVTTDADADRTWRQLKAIKVQMTAEGLRF